MKEPTLEELEANVTYVEEFEGGEFGGSRMESRDRYVYFDKASSDVRIPIGYSEFKIPLSLDNYGFPSSRKITFAGKREVALNDALDNITGLINDSTEYDTERAYRAIEAGALPLQLKELLLSSGYKPRGDETFKGICSDAGRRIRSLLKEKLADQTTLRCLHVSSHSNSISHDTTLVFDTKGARWAVLNSKSPLKPYNLVPKERLKELGSPYTSFKS